jgi:5-methylthioribose kinase
MVLGHGDEHLRNLFLNKDKKSERKYWVIDPRSAGFYSPAHAINNLIGGAHLFFYEYAQKINQTENTISIIYEILPEYQKAKIIIDKNFKLLIESLQNLSKEPFLLKEYLFANLIRSYIKRVNPKRIDEIYKNSQSHLATANELYYKDYVNLF